MSSQERNNSSLSPSKKGIQHISSQDLQPVSQADKDLLKDLRRKYAQLDQERKNNF